MPENTNEAAQRKRRRGAWKGALTATLWLVLSALALAILGLLYVPEGIWRALMFMAALMDLGMIVPIWILLRVRLKEIEGGEEDAAAQY